MSPSQVTQLFKDGELTYIGGKFGGQALGAGAYFDMNGGGNTGYANGATMIAVLNPAKARTIDRYTLQSRAASLAKSHPKFAKAAGSYYNAESIYALAMGNNVITAPNGYHNVIDRSAVVVRQRDL